jgi:hypothetical protein
VQSLPLMLVGGVVLALVGTRTLQLVQSKVFHVIPFGLLTDFNILDACVGILVSGAFMLYFGGCCLRVAWPVRTERVADLVVTT